jgi:tetratricopeptide (TPR) repeat protein
MKSILLLLSFLGVLRVACAQDSLTQKLVAELSENSCLCIDSISTSGKARNDISKEIKACLDKQVMALQLGSRLAAIVPSTADDKKKKRKRDKPTKIELDSDPNSTQFQQYYFQLERYSVANCGALKRIINTDDSGERNTMSKNPESLKWYTAGVAALDAQKYDEAAVNFKAAVAVDSLFSFAWDNLGIAYRKLARYPEALAAYQKSIAVNPTGVVPWQNIAIVYEYQKDYLKAIDAYKRLEQKDSKNPEVYYGIGRIYATNLHEYEKALENMCIAYKLYIELGSPYRTDAEKVINEIYMAMRKEGNEKRFREILKEHRIDMN